MEKRIFLQTAYAKVTNEYVLFNGTWKIDIQKINAVFITKQVNNRHHYILIGLFILLTGFIFESTLLIITGLLFCIGAIFIKSNYMLRLKIDTGEIRPIKSTNKRELEDIKEAIGKAMFYDEDEDAYIQLPTTIDI